VVEAVAAAGIPEAAEALVKASECRGLEGTRPGDGSLVLGDPRRETGLAEEFGPAAVQPTDIELLGDVVLEVELAGGPGEACGGAEGGEAAGLVAGSTEAGLVDEALDQEDRLAVMEEPVLAKALEDEGKDARGQVGKLVAVGEDQEAGVVHDHAEATGALAGGPADPLVACLDVEGGTGEEEDGDGLAVELGDVAQGRSGNLGLVEVVVVLQAPVELGPLIRPDQTHLHALEQIGLRRGVLGRHRPGA